MKSSNHLIFSAPEGSRTPNLLIRSQMLYPVKLRVQRAANIENSQKDFSNPVFFDF